MPARAQGELGLPATTKEVSFFTRPSRTRDEPESTVSENLHSFSGWNDAFCPFNDPRQWKVCCKDCIIVVIHQFDEHYVAVPVFSYGGRGIGWMTDRRKAEYMDIHDHHNPPADNVRQNSLPVLTTKQMQHWSVPLNPHEQFTTHTLKACITGLE
jgi:hypothetical protein